MRNCGCGLIFAALSSHQNEAAIATTNSLAPVSLRNHHELSSRSHPAGFMLPPKQFPPSTRKETVRHSAHPSAQAINRWNHLSIKLTSMQRATPRPSRSSLRAAGGGDGSSAGDDIIISAPDRVRVLLYRTCLVLASVGYAGIALKGFLGSAGSIGLSDSAVAALGESSSSLAGWMVGVSALLAPRGADSGIDGADSEETSVGGVEVATLAIDSALPIAAASSLLVRVVCATTGAENVALIGDLSSELSAVSIALVCAREMAYFGVGYKVEAAIAFFLLFLEPVLGGSASEMPLAFSAGLALSLLVLSFAKVFEPVVEDLRPGGSQFFAEGQQQIPEKNEQEE